MNRSIDEYMNQRCPFCDDHVIYYLDKENQVFECDHGHAWKLPRRPNPPPETNTS